MFVTDKSFSSDVVSDFGDSDGIGVDGACAVIDVWSVVAFDCGSTVATGVGVDSMVAVCDAEHPARNRGAARAIEQSVMKRFIRIPCMLVSTNPRQVVVTLCDYHLMCLSLWL